MDEVLDSRDWYSGCSRKQKESLNVESPHLLNSGLLATQSEIDQLTLVLGYAPRSYQAFLKEVLPV